MKTKRLLFVLISCILVLVLVLAACKPNTPTPPEEPDWQNPGDSLGGGGQGEIPDSADTTGIDAAIKAVKDASDLSSLAEETSYDNATKVEPTAGVVEISKAGTYLFEGDYGGILVTKKDLALHFVLKNANFTNENGIAIDCQDKKVASLIITLVDGTTNTVTNDGDDVNAIHVKGGVLSINGKGVLNVESKSKSAIKCARAIQIVDATLNLTAANHALTGSAVTAANCEINVLAAGKDGINAECNDYTEQENFTDDGFVALTNVDYTCNVSGDGIQANTVVYVDGGNYDITTNGKFVEDTAANRDAYGLTDDDFKYVQNDAGYKRIAIDDKTKATRYALAQGCKGIRIAEIEYSVKDESGAQTDVVVTDVDYVIAIVDGTFNVNSSDDAIHSNSGSIAISGGEFTVATLDDAIISDILTKISGGEISITNCFEGIEGAHVEISGGTVDIVATDDGINASSENETITPHIIISGGSVTVNSDGDGIDSNGSILISGGTVVVYGPTTGGNAGLDSDKGIVITGGTVFATSTLGMVETPSKNSTQCVVSYAQQSVIKAGSTVSLLDKDGNELLSYEVLKNCQSIILSCATLQKGGIYTVSCTTTGESSSSKVEVTFTITDIISKVGSSVSTSPNGGRPPRP